MFSHVSVSVAKFQGLVQVLIGLIILLIQGSFCFGFWRDLALFPKSLGLYALVMSIGIWLSRAERKSNFLSSLDMNLVTIHYMVSRRVFIVLMLLLLTHALMPEHSVTASFIISFSVIFYAFMMLLLRPVTHLISTCFQNDIYETSLLVGSVQKNKDFQKRSNKGSLPMDGFDSYYTDILEEELVEVDLQGRFFSELNELMVTNTFSQILLTQIPKNSTLSREVVKFCNHRGIRLFIVNDLHAQFGHSLHLSSFEGCQLISLREEPLSEPFNRMLKRLLDLAIALPLFIMTLPVFLIVAIIHAIQSPGPLFFIQRRAGLKNHVFCIYKFRSMDAINDSPAKQVEENDRRVYPLGRLLRKYSIDEIPQFLNVIKGDMSIVGPRPHMLEHNKEFEKYLSHYNVRTFIKPGMTGLAQVRGYRGETSSLEQIEKRVKSDVFYLENWTFTLDLLIVLRTILQMFKPSKKAY